jgi:hypothetical protein
MKRFAYILAVFAMSFSVAHAATFVAEKDTTVFDVAKKTSVIYAAFIYAMNPNIKDSSVKAGQSIIYISKNDMLEALAFCGKESVKLQKLSQTDTRNYTNIKKDMNELKHERIRYSPEEEYEDVHEGIHWKAVLRHIAESHKNQLALKKP